MASPTQLGFSQRTSSRFPARFPIIAGPTASGKTAVGVEVCKALVARGLPAEVVTADAYQVYRGMDIGTAKPKTDERQGIPHHLIDIVEPTAAFTVADWLAAATQIIDSLRARGVVPVVVGGTHLYVKSLIDGMFEGPGGDETLRAELRATPINVLRAELDRVDPIAAARIHFNDVRRTIRAIEVFRLTGVPISTHQAQWDKAGAEQAGSDRILVAIEWPVETLNARINQRVREMVSRGLVEEVRGLYDAAKFGSQSREAVGYKQLIEHFAKGDKKHPTLDEALEAIKIQTRHVGKAQRTWIRRLRSTSTSVLIDAEALPADGLGSDVNHPWVMKVLGAMRLELE